MGNLRKTPLTRPTLNIPVYYNNDSGLIYTPIQPTSVQYQCKYLYKQTVVQYPITPKYFCPNVYKQINHNQAMKTAIPETLVFFNGLVSQDFDVFFISLRENKSI
jgi:hypothetical protein